ncbi:MAG: hypothetical protein L6R37_003546 [Teloschistes peruensis]|nr:MAG: hypothetical protein L6R37_003546 [Teloschistes peruensis]
MVQLRLNFAPTQPSLLRHVSAPRSPASPLETTAKHLRYTLPIRLTGSASGMAPSTVSSGPPPSPHNWMWYCHQCRTGYKIGVTRRCLIDDHMLCYGTTIKKKAKKSKKVKACQSEFDYVGWANWGEWKRKETGKDSQAEEQPKRDCFGNCDWPSQCRWAPKQQIQPAVQPQQETAQEADPQSQSACTSADPSPGAKPTTDNVLVKLGSATQKLASHWASMLTPIEEDPAEQSPTSIKDFLDLGKQATEPMLFSVAPLGISSKHTSSTPQPPTEVHSATNFNNFDFDFGFHSSAAGGDNDNNMPPSIAKGIVASTVGLALSAVPSARVQDGGDERSKRCASEPLPTLSVWLQERVTERRRRMSEAR